MQFEDYSPKPPLDSHIESIFYYKDFMPEHSIERLVPTGHIFLIFEFDGIPRTVFDNETQEPREVFTEVWISGMQTGCITISSHEHSEMLVVQFKPAGASPFFTFSINDLADRIIPAQKVLGNEILQLRADLLHIDFPQRKFVRIEEFLKNRYDGSNVSPKGLLAVLRRLQKEPVANLSNIAAKYPNTQKHLIHQFKKFVGLTPKVYQRIVRFNGILQKIQNKEHITWAEIAYECGYADQSHFIKEFSHFSGFNPQEFIDHEYNKAEPNFFPLDERG